MQLETQNSPPNPFPLYPGELNLIVGRPGIGKSLLALDLAARAANASLPRHYLPEKTPDPDDQSPDAYTPGDAIILSTENRNLPVHLLAFGIHPSAGKMPHRDERSLDPYYSDFYHKSAGRHYDQSPFITWLRHEDRTHTRVLVLDPLPAFIGPMNATSRVITDQLEPLLEYATSRGIFVIGITHLVKMARGMDSVHQIVGSLGYSAIARCILLVTHDAHPPAGSDPLHRRLILPIKNNLAAIEAAYAFTFRSRPPLQPPTKPPELPPLTQDSPYEDREAHVLAEPALKRHREEQSIYTRHSHSGEPLPPQLIWDQQPLHHHPQLPNLHLAQQLSLQAQENIALNILLITRAKELLIHLLKNGPIRSSLAYQCASREGISRRTLERARKDLQIPWRMKHVPEEPGGYHSEIYLPEPGTPCSGESAKVARARTENLADT